MSKTKEEYISELNSILSKTIMDAENLDRQSIKAWEQVQSMEEELSKLLPEGAERDISIRGAAYAYSKILVRKLPI